MKTRSILLMGVLLLCFGTFVIAVHADSSLKSGSTQLSTASNGLAPYMDPTGETDAKLSESEKLARNEVIKDSLERLKSQESVEQKDQVTTEDRSPTLVERLMERLANGGNLTPAEKQILDSYNAQHPFDPRNGNSLDNTGTQDAYGYNFVDNVLPDTATYTWIEVCDSTGYSTGPTGDDASTGPNNIGFTFPFYGTNYTQFYVATNGVISFGGAVGGSGQYQANDPQTTAPTYPYVAPMWLDFNTTASALGGCTATSTGPWILYETFGTAPNQYLVIEYRRMPEFSSGTLISFEVILYANGKVKVQFSSTEYNAPTYAPTNRNWAVGIDAPGAGNGSRYYYHSYSPSGDYGFVPAAGRAVWFFTPPPLDHNFGTLSITSPGSGTYQPNQMVNVVATFKNWGSTSEFSPVKYTFNGGATVTGQTSVLATNATEVDTFATQIQMPAADGSYPLTVWSDLPGDAYRANDTLRMNVQVLNCTRPLPWSENFDAVAAPAMPPCWRVVHAGPSTYSWQTYNSSTYAHSSPISLCMDSPGGYGIKNEWAYTPFFSLLATQSYVFDFWVRGYSTSYTDSLEVKYGATQDSTAMVNTLVARYKDNVNTTYQHQQITFTPPANGVYTFGFHSTTGTASGYNPIIDDVLLYASGTCAAPTVTVNSPIGQDSAALVATVTGGFGGPVQYQWYTGTSCQNGNEIPSATAATYYAHTSGSYSCKAWMVDPVGCSSCAFGTATVIDCSIPTALPWTEGFEGTTGTALPPCWTVREYDTDNRVWATLSSYAHTGTRSAYCTYSSSGVLPNDWVFSPRFALTAGTNHLLDFWAREYLTSTSYYDSILVVLTSAPDNNSVVQTLIPTFRLTSGTYSEYQVQFTPPSTGNYYLAFIYRGSANAGGIVVDDISLISFPNGMPQPPTNLQGTVNNTTVTLTWTDPNQDVNGNPLAIDSIQVFRGNDQPASQIAHVAHGVQTIVLNNEPTGRNTYCIRAKYQSYVSTSTCIPLIVGNPSYSNNFDTDNGGLTGTAGWQWGPPTNSTGPAAAFSAPNVWAIGLNANYVAYQCDDLYVDLGQMVVSPTASMEFYAWCYLETCCDGVNLKGSTDNGTTWQLLHPSEHRYDAYVSSTSNCLAPDSVWNAQTNGWVHVTVPLGQFVGQIPILRFKFGADLSIQYAGFFIDDMIIWGLQSPTPDSARNVTAYRVDATRPDSCIEVRFDAPNAGSYQIWSTTDKNSAWQPGGVWTLETTLSVPAGLNAWRDPAALQTFKRYVVSQVAP
jgi:hypothetical protein